MSVDGFFPGLAQGPFLLFAFIIGLVVSMDVAVVEITRDYKKEDRNGNSHLWTSRMRTMMFLHAGFHSVSFFVYMIFIFLAQYLVFLPINIEFLDLPEDFGLGLLTIINFFIVMFIWWTYKSKVKEDHSEKTDDSDMAGRKDMKFFVDCVRAVSHKIGWGGKVAGAAVAGSVAVDMLAVSALLKGVLLPNGGEAPIASWSGILLLDLVVFASIIFVVVAIVVLIAQMLGTVVRKFHYLLAVLLRVLEPFAVFFILAGVARLVAAISFENLPTVYTVYGDLIDAIFAMVVTISLFWSNGIGPRRLLQLYAKRSEDEYSINPKITINELMVEIKGFVPAIWVFLSMFVIIFVCMWYAYSTDPGRETHNHLVEATGYIAGLVVIFTILFLYAPLKRLDDWETSKTANFHRMFRAMPKDLFNRLGAVIIALAALNIHTSLMLGRTFVLGAIATWSIYVLLGWLLFDLRRWRFYKSDPAGQTGRTNNADYTELFTAFGLASSVVALVAFFFVRQLIG